MTYTKPILAIAVPASELVQSGTTKAAGACRDAGTLLSGNSTSGAYELDE